MEKYIDRQHAGKVLAALLKAYANQPDVIALGLPRGGVPIAYEIAQALSIPLGVFIVRKLGVPGHPELAMGALASGGVVYLDEKLIHHLKITSSAIEQVKQAEALELSRRQALYLPCQQSLNACAKTVLLIDDGIATGATMQVAIAALRQQHPAKIIVAVPVAALETCKQIEKNVDKLICPMQPSAFIAVGVWYESFSQTSDEEVCELLSKVQT
jgi:putative phosphoribosyl transferase